MLLLLLLLLLFVNFLSISGSNVLKHSCYYYMAD